MALKCSLTQRACPVGTATTTLALGKAWNVSALIPVPEVLSATTVLLTSAPQCTVTGPAHALWPSHSAKERNAPKRVKVFPNIAGLLYNSFDPGRLHEGTC